MKHSIPSITIRILTAIAVCIFSQQSAAQQSWAGTDSVYHAAVDTTLSAQGQVLSKTERMYFFLGHIGNNTDQGFDTKDIERKLPQLEDNLKTMSESLTAKTGTPNLRNL